MVIAIDTEKPSISQSEEFAQLRVEAAQFGDAATVDTVDGVPAIIFQGNDPGNCDMPTTVEQGCVPAQKNPSSVRLEIGEYAGLGLWSSGLVAEPNR